MNDGCVIMCTMESTRSRLIHIRNVNECIHLFGWFFETYRSVWYYLMLLLLYMVVLNLNNIEPQFPQRWFIDNNKKNMRLNLLCAHIFDSDTLMCYRLNFRVVSTGSISLLLKHVDAFVGRLIAQQHYCGASIGANGLARLRFFFQLRAEYIQNCLCHRHHRRLRMGNERQQV